MDSPALGRQPQDLSKGLLGPLLHLPKAQTYAALAVMYYPGIGHTKQVFPRHGQASPNPG